MSTQGEASFQPTYTGEHVATARDIVEFMKHHYWPVLVNVEEARVQLEMLEFKIKQGTATGSDAQTNQERDKMLEHLQMLKETVVRMQIYFHLNPQREWQARRVSKVPWLKASDFESSSATNDSASPLERRYNSMAPVPVSQIWRVPPHVLLNGRQQGEEYLRQTQHMYQVTQQFAAELRAARALGQTTKFYRCSEATQNRLMTILVTELNKQLNVINYIDHEQAYLQQLQDARMPVYSDLRWNPNNPTARTCELNEVENTGSPGHCSPDCQGLNCRMTRRLARRRS